MDLPPGEGREILLESCLSCHQLGALALFKGYYTRELWRDLLLSMQANGAELEEPEMDVLANYLAQYFGPDAP